MTQAADFTINGYMGAMGICKATRTHFSSEILYLLLDITNLSIRGLDCPAKQLILLLQHLKGVLAVRSLHEQSARGCGNTGKMSKHCSSPLHTRRQRHNRSVAPHKSLGTGALHLNRVLSQVMGQKEDGKKSEKLPDRWMFKVQLSRDTVWST